MGEGLLKLRRRLWLEGLRWGMSPTETDDEKAVRLLTRQLEEVKDIRPLNWRHPKFKAWRDTTMTVLEKFVGPNSTYLSTYRNLRFFEPRRMITVGFGGPPPPPPDYVSPEDAAAYQGACEASEETLRAAIRHIKDFGVYVEHLQAVSSRRGKAGSTGHGGGQHFYGPIKNVAIAADNAAQIWAHAARAIASKIPLRIQRTRLTEKTNIAAPILGKETQSDYSAIPKRTRLIKGRMTRLTASADHGSRPNLTGETKIQSSCSEN